MVHKSLRGRLVASYVALVLAVTVVGFVTVKLTTPALYDQRIRSRNGAGAGRGFGQGGTFESGDAAPTQLDEAYGDALNSALLISALVGLVLAVLIGLWLSRRIVSRLDELRNATHRLSAGDYSREAPIPPEVELAELTDSVNKLRSDLQSTEQTRARLVSDLAHELRNPLATIEGYMEGLIDGVLPANDATFTTVATETHRLQRLTEDLSLLSRAQEGALDLRKEPLSLSAVADSVINKLQPQYDAKGVQLTNQVVDPLPVIGDSDRLVQALTNVVGNALTNTPAGGSVIVSGTIAAGQVTMRVTDTGVGIPPHELEEVFRRFARLNPEGNGTGIGLSVARALIRLHNGDLTAHSSGVGAGASFEFVLPAAASAAWSPSDPAAVTP